MRNGEQLLAEIEIKWNFHILYFIILHFLKYYFAIDIWKGGEKSAENCNTLKF